MVSTQYYQSLVCRCFSHEQLIRSRSNTDNRKTDFETNSTMSKTEETLRACGRWICHSFDILKAILMRVIFALHATIAIIRIVVTKGDYWYLLNMCGVNFLLIELIITIVKRKGLSSAFFSCVNLVFVFFRERTKMVNHVYVNNECRN